MNRFIRYYFAITGLLLLVACSPKILITNPEKLERKKTGELVSTLDSLFLRKPEFFYSKISTKFKDTNQSVSFKTSVRMVKDSAINATISYAAIPIFGAMLTKDSLTIVNKRNKCYTKAKLSTLKENLGYAFEFNNVEELLLGIPLGYDTNQKYFQIYDPFNYIISSHRKREIKRTIKGKLDKKKEEDEEEVIIKYYLTNDARGLKRMEIESPSDSTKVQIDYLSREMVDNYDVPKEVYVQVFTAKNTIHVNLDYEKIEINQRQPLIMVIPESYGICE